MDEQLYSVYLDGLEANDYYLPLDKATQLKEELLEEGYTGVQIVKIENTAV